MTTLYCPQCDARRPVIEVDAFRGRDTTRSTLNCGHVVAKTQEKR